MINASPIKITISTDKSRAWFKPVRVEYKPEPMEEIDIIDLFSKKHSELKRELSTLPAHSNNAGGLVIEMKDAKLKAHSMLRQAFKRGSSLSVILHFATFPHKWYFRSFVAANYHQSTHDFFRIVPTGKIEFR